MYAVEMSFNRGFLGADEVSYVSKVK